MIWWLSFGWFLATYVGNISRIARIRNTQTTALFAISHRAESARLRDSGFGDFGRVRGNEILAQCRLVDLAGGVARQGIDEFYHARPLEARQIGFAVRVNLRFGDAVARLHGDDRHANLAPLFAGNADDSGFGDRGDLVEHVLDLGRINVFAAGNVHVLPAIHDVIKTFLVDPRGIAGMEPAVGEGGRVGVRPVPVTGRDVRPPNPEFAELADADVSAVRPDDPHFGMQHRLAGGACLARGILSIERHDRRTGLGHAVTLLQRDATLLPHFQKRHR